MGQNSKEKHRGMPSVEKIIKYWTKNYKQLGETRKGEWGIEIYECFACGDCYYNLDRCHIIPSAFGGSNHVSNLHILCRKCHIESEGLKLYWNWFHWKRQNEWDYGMNHITKRLTTYGINLEEEAKKVAEKYEYNVELAEIVHWELWNKIYYTVKPKPESLKTLKDFQKKI